MKTAHGRLVGRCVFLAPVVALLALWWIDAGAAPLEWTPLPPATWEQQARPDSGGRNVIFLLDESEATDRRDGYRLTIHRRLRIFTEEGRSAGTIEIDHLKGGAKLLDLRARSVRPNGATTELAPDQILTSTIWKSGSVEYNRTTAIVPGIEPGCVVEYAYTIDGKLDGPPAIPWSFQNEYYTVECRVRWKLLKDPYYEPRWETRRIGRDYVGHRCTPDCEKPTEMSFVVYATPGTRDEPWMPPRAASGPRLFTYYMIQRDDPIAFWSRWKFWFNEIARQFEESTGEFDGVISRARAASPEPERQLESAFRWIRGNLHSTAEPSWQELQTRRSTPSFWGKNQAIKHLLLRREGSPYEINLAFANAARALGFEARVLLLRDRREGSFEYDIVGQGPTNAVTAIRRKSTDSWRYFQPASRFSVPGSVPWYERSGPGLATGKEAELTLHVMPDNGLPGEARWDLALKLDAAGTLGGRVSGRLDGELARSYRARLWEEDPARYAEVLAGDLSADKSPALELVAPNLSAPPESAFTTTGTVSYPKIAVTAGGLTTIPVASLVPWRLEGDFTQERRAESIFFRCPQRQVVDVDIDLAAHGVVDEVPQARQFENEIGAWRSSWKRTADGVRLERVVELRHGEYSPSKYAAVRAFFAGLKEADGELLLVRKP